MSDPKAYCETKKWAVLQYSLEGEQEVAKSTQNNTVVQQIPKSDTNDTSYPTRQWWELYPDNTKTQSTQKSCHRVETIPSDRKYCIAHRWGQNFSRVPGVRACVQGDKSFPGQWLHGTKICWWLTRPHSSWSLNFLLVRETTVPCCSPFARNSLLLLLTSKHYFNINYTSPYPLAMRWMCAHLEVSFLRTPFWSYFHPQEDTCHSTYKWATGYMLPNLKVKWKWLHF